MSPLGLRHLPSLAMAQGATVLDLLAAAGYRDMHVLESSVDTVDAAEVNGLLGAVGCPPDFRAAAAGDLARALLAAAPFPYTHLTLAMTRTATS